MDEIEDAVRLYSVRTVAERMEMSRDWVYAQIRAGRLRAVELGDTRAHTRVRSDDLQAFIDARTFERKIEGSD
ncbi:helix-turn-helix transcriptional regulator [Leifsonia sp. P73]|uniref:helix-turn-helix transcriptional regulator n=1 Tax=Leifsonia sp. P73 TaxID=3423959 RepID=UPI003DA54D48